MTVNGFPTPAIDTPYLRHYTHLNLKPAAFVLLPHSEGRRQHGKENDMAETLKYIELLNDIRLQETRAGIFLKAWAEKTTSSDLKGCLSLVAERETSHGDIFERRIRELGYSAYEKEDPIFADRLRVASSDMTDVEKIAWMRDAQSRAPKPTVRERYEAAAEDESVDPLTRSLIRWFTGVEDDSGASMRQVYAQLEQAG